MRWFANSIGLLFGYFLFCTAVSAQTPTWSEDVASIVYSKCSSCHHTGGIAPFSLMNYQEAQDNALGILNAVSSRYMPPWPPDPTYRRYAHEKFLSDAEINTIVSWINGGTPQGNPNLAPTPPTFNNNGLLQNPDLTLTIPTYTSTATNFDIYRCFAIPSGLTTDKFLQGLEIIPGNPSIVHHVLVFVDTTGTCQQLDNNDPLPGYTSFGGVGTNNAQL
ncbi:MAG: cytochrome c, partial [Bacteroidia bacterium]|nr:cytochrome c [Bacteroidia bacterium]